LPDVDARLVQLLEALTARLQDRCVEHLGAREAGATYRLARLALRRDPRAVNSLSELMRHGAGGMPAATHEALAAAKVAAEALASELSKAATP